MQQGTEYLRAKMYIENLAFSALIQLGFLKVVSTSCIIKIIKILVNCHSLFLIPGRNTITFQSNFSL